MISMPHRPTKLLPTWDLCDFRLPEACLLRQSLITTFCAAYWQASQGDTAAGLDSDTGAVHEDYDNP